MRSSFREAVVPPRRWPLPPPVADMLQTGGDSRVRCDPLTGLTGYGSALQPRPRAIGLASCTASTISVEGLAAAEASRRRLAQAALDGDVTAELQRQGGAIRAAIAAHFALPSGAGVVLAASGTDAELLALALAAPAGQPVFNVLIAPEESGSGVPYAAAACHFADITASGSAVQRGSVVEGFPPVTLRSIPGRDADGRLRPNAAVIAACAAAVQEAEAEGAHALLHLLDGSKTGYVLPDPVALHCLATRHAGSVRVVVDACQGRGEPERIRFWLAQSWVVLITGSKFYGGPPFAGAVLLPPARVDELKAACPLPAGLADYTARADWPEQLAPARELPSAGNPGLLLRWHAALAGMAAYRRTPRKLRAARLARFAAALPAMIDARPDLQRIETPTAEGVIPTIFSFVVRRAGQPLDVAEARCLHRWLNQDLSFLPGLSADQARLARRICLIGQPVALSSGAVLRIAAGARAGAARVADAAIVLRKITLIVQNWTTLFEKL